METIQGMTSRFFVFFVLLLSKLILQSNSKSQSILPPFDYFKTSWTSFAFFLRCVVSADATFALRGAHRAHGVHVRRARVFAGVVDVCTGCIEFFRAVFEVARECA